MPITVRGGTYSGIKYGGTAAPAWPTNIAANDVVYATVFNGGGTLTVPAGWTLVKSQATSSASTILSVYRHVYASGDTASTWGMSGSTQWGIEYVALTGVDTSILEDASSSNNLNPTTTQVLPPVNVAAASNGFVLYAVGGYGTNSTVSGSGFNSLYDYAHQHVGYATPSSPGQYTSPTITYATSQSSASLAAIAVSIKPAGVSSYIFGPTSVSKPSLPSIPGENALNSVGVLSPIRPRYKQGQSHSGLVHGGNMSIFSRCKNVTGVLQTDQLTTRRRHVALADGNDLRLTFPISNKNETLIGNDVTVQCMIEVLSVGDTSGNSPGNYTNYPVTFRGGQKIGNGYDGSVLVSDPLPWQVKTGEVYYTTTLVRPATLAASGNVPVTFGTNTALYEYMNTTATTLAVPTTGSDYFNGFSPVAVFATPRGRAGYSSVAIVGDSIMQGVSRTPTYSWSEQTLSIAGIPHFNLGLSGEQAVQFVNSSGGGNRFSGIRYRGVLLSGATDILSDYGRNDFTAGGTLADMQVRNESLAALAASYGARYHCTTLTPHTTSTDSWASAANQTMTSTGSASQAYNAWLRDGAPRSVTTGAALATGVAAGTNVMRVGDPRHPITGGIIDVAAAVESVLGSGLWHPNAMTNDGLHPGDSGHNMMSLVFATYCANHFAPVV